MRSTTTVQERRAKKKAQQELEWRNEITNYVPFSNKSINSNPSSNNNSPPKQPIIHSENTTAVSSPSLSNAPSSPLPNVTSITTESDTHSAIAIDTSSSPVKTAAATDEPSTTAPPSDFQFSAAPILSPREQEESSKIDAWRTRRRSASQDHEKLRREKEEMELKFLEEEDAKVTELVEEVETLAQQITHQVVTNKSRPKRLSTTTLRKSPLKREFNKIVRFNIMTAGEPGCGKSTFIKSLLDKLDPDTDCKLYQSLAKELHLEKDAINSLHQSLSSSAAGGGEQQELRQLGKMEWLSDKGNMISFSVAESIRYGDSTNNASIISTIKETIQIAHNKRNAQQPQLMSEQEVLDADDRIHVLFYFISPHRMKEIDIEFITQLAPLVPIIPIIAKADAMTMNERNSFLQIVKTKLNTISQPMKESCIYDFYDGMMSSPTSPTKETFSSSSSAAILSPTAFLSPLSPLPLRTSDVLLQLESSEAENEVDAVDTDLEVDDDDETDTIPSPVRNKSNSNSNTAIGANMRKRPSVATPSPTRTVPSLPPQLPLVNENNIFPTICGSRDYPWGTAALNTSCSSKVVMYGNNANRMSYSGVSELERLQDNLISSEFQLRDLLTATQTKSIALYKSAIKAALLQPLPSPSKNSQSSTLPLSHPRDQAAANAGSRIKNGNNNGSRILNTDNSSTGLRGSKTAESSPERQGGGTNIRRSQSSRELHSAASAGSPALLKATSSTRWGTSAKTADTAASSAGGDSKSTESTPRNLRHFRTALSTFFTKKTNKE